ncbi:hypothetical protein [Sinomonas sp. G460-2]
MTSSSLAAASTDREDAVPTVLRRPGQRSVRPITSEELQPRSMTG